MYLNLPGHLPATYCPMYGSLSSAINERKLCCHTDHSFTAHSILGALPAACFSLQCTETALVVIGGLLILNPMKIVFSEFTELLCCFWEFCLCFHSWHSLISYFTSYHGRNYAFWGVISLTFYPFYKIIPLSTSVPNCCSQCNSLLLDYFYFIYYPELSHLFLRLKLVQMHWELPNVFFHPILLYQALYWDRYSGSILCISHRHQHSSDEMLISNLSPLTSSNTSLSCSLLLVSHFLNIIKIIFPEFCLLNYFLWVCPFPFQVKSLTWGSTVYHLAIVHISNWFPSLWFCPSQIYPVHSCQRKLKLKYA